MLFKPCLRRRVHAAFANHFYSGASQFEALGFVVSHKHPAEDVVRYKQGRITSSAGCLRSEEHTSELQSLMRISYAVFCLKTQTKKTNTDNRITPLLVND